MTFMRAGSSNDRFFVEGARRDPGLDFLRALAISLVMVRHFLDRNRMYEPALPESLQLVGLFGWAGVDLFFVLSGFLIFKGIFEREREGQFSWFDFYWNRAMRIWPAYYVSLVICMLTGLFAVNWSELPCFLVFLQNYCGPLSALNGGVYWSLAVEEHFYLVAPLLLMASRRFAPYRPHLLIAGIAIAPLIRFVLYELVVNGKMYDFYFRIYFPTHSRYDSLLVGVLCAYLAVNYQKALSGRAAQIALPIAFIGLIYAAVETTSPLSRYGQQPSLLAGSIGFSLTALFWGVTLLSTQVFKLFGYFGGGVVRWVAQLSYSMYLFHIVILTYANSWLRPTSLDTILIYVHAFAYFVGVVGVSWACYALVERRFLLMKRR